MERRKPGYQLSHIKARLNRTFSSKQGAVDLGMDDEAVVALIQALKHSDFEKSMTSIADHKVWQDVYRPTTVDGRIVYVKFTLERTEGVVAHQLQGGLT